MKDMLRAYIPHTAIKWIMKESKALSDGWNFMELRITDDLDFFGGMIFIYTSKFTSLRISTVYFFSEFDLKHRIALIFNRSFNVFLFCLLVGS